MDITVRNILIWVASILGAGAIGTFLSTGVFNSPITVSAVLIAIGAIIFVGTTKTDDRPVEIAGTVLSAFAVIIASLYSVMQLTSGTIMITLTLTILAIVFGFAAHTFQTDSPLLTPKQVKIAVIIVVIIAVSIIAVDVAAGEPQQTVTLYDSIEQNNSADYGPEYVIGEVTFTNPSPLPQRLGYDSRVTYQACLTGVSASDMTNDSRQQQELERHFNNVHLSQTSTNQVIFDSYTSEIGFPSHIVDMLEQGDVNATEVSVVTAETCPDETEDPQITVITDSKQQVIPQ